MRLLCTLCAALLLTVCYAQDIPILKYTSQEGMGHSIVYSIYQSQDGYLWFSTDNGLTRYDGKQFRNFTGKDGFESGFIFDVITHNKTMFASEYGTGIVAYVPGKGFEHTTFQDQPSYPLFLAKAYNTLWIIDRKRFLYRLKDQKFEKIGVNAASNFHQMVQLKSGELITICRGVFRWNETLQHLDTVETKGFPFLGDSTFYSVVELPYDRLLVTSPRHLFAISLKSGQVQCVMNSDFMDRSKPLLVDHQNNIWVNNIHGELWRLSPDFKKKERVLTGVLINDMYEDTDHNLWLATYGKGAWCIPNLSVRNYTMNDAIPHDLALDQKTRLPIISSINSCLYTLGKGKYPSVKKWEELAFLRKRTAITLLSLPSGEYLTANYGAFYHINNNKFDSVPLNSTPSALFKSRDKSYWVGLRGGLKYISPDFKERRYISQFSKRIVRAIAEDKQGNLLVGTDRGLYVGFNDKWEIFGKKEGLPNDYVNSIAFDSARNGYWIGTNEGIGFLLANKMIVKFKQDVALKRCNSAIIDRNNDVWAATINGLLQITPDNKFHLYNQEDGLCSDISKIVYDRQSDKIYFLAESKLVEIKIEEFKKQQTKVIPKIAVENIRWNDHDQYPYPNREIVSLRKVQALTFNVARPGFKRRNSWKLQYRINKNAWAFASYPNEFTLYEIPYGIFTVDISLIDQNNVRSSITSVHFNYSKPVYFRTWFITISTLLTFVSVVLTTRYFTWKVSYKKEQALLSEQQKFELEQKALRNMLNPHFMNNALNSIQAFVTLNDQRTTLSYLSKFAKLMRVNLELLENSTVTLNKEIQNVELYLAFEKLRFDRLTYLIEVDEEVDSERLRIPSLVIQPFVENAIWHGILHKAVPGHVRVHIFQKEKYLHIIVDDNGIGIVTSQQQKANQPCEKPSRGLFIIKSRFAIMNKICKGHSLTVADKSQLDPAQQGTLIEIILPVVY